LSSVPEPAGQTVAFKLKENGLKVAVVEKSDRPGGTCELAGCQPKKWFYEAAEAIAKSRHPEGKGIVAASEGNWGQVLEQKQTIVSPYFSRESDLSYMLKPLLSD
jgi:glutathione reductase (NADPH)